MSTALRAKMTLEHFLAWEERQPLRYEFDGWQPVAMTGGTVAHELIGGTLRALLYERLRGKPCRSVGPTLKIEVMGRIRYPDAFVYCAPVVPGATVIREPVVVFEVLSDSSVNDDLVVKNAEYRATPSVLRYVVLQQAAAGATVFARKGGEWVADVVAGPDGILQMPEIGIAIPLAEIYADVAFDADPEPAEAAG